VTLFKILNTLQFGKWIESTTANPTRGVKISPRKGRGVVYDSCCNWSSQRLQKSSRRWMQDDQTVYLRYNVYTNC